MSSDKKKDNRRISILIPQIIQKYRFRELTESYTNLLIYIRDRRYLIGP